MKPNVDANKDIEETNRALEDLRDFTKLMNDSASQMEPKLEDYYQPSDEMKTYAMMTMGLIGIGSAYGLTRIL
jgi:soluble cytochrome b562